MSEQGGFESGNRSPKKESKEAGFARRDFLRGALIVGGGIVAGAVLGPTAMKKARKWHEAQKEIEFIENVEKEKEEVKKDIALGSEYQVKFQEFLTEHNGLVEMSRRLDKHSDEYKGIVNQANALYREAQGFYVKRGSLKVGLLKEANSYAERLGKNDAAIGALAVARVSYRNGVDHDDFGNKEFSYWHNFAHAYLGLADKSQEQIKAKFKTLFEYAKANDVKISHVPAEQIVYYLIDDNFDLSLKPVALESLLTERFPTWKQHPPTHSNKEYYAHYNDLSVLDIFELNRLKSVISQLENSVFVSDVFKFRDEDIKDTNTEFGGIIPLPNKGNLQVISADRVLHNRTRVVPDKQLVELLASVAEFHFHATKVEEPPSHHGPSGPDHAFFAPGVVFSSVNDSTILVHFYASRSFYTRDPYYKLNVRNEVVCLGEIKRPRLSEKKEMGSPPRS